jgi:hypothetical protein
LGCVSSRYSMIASDSNRIGPSLSVKAGARPSPRQGHTGRTTTGGRSLEFDTVAFRILRVDRRALAFGNLGSHLRTAGGALPGKMFC